MSFEDVKLIVGIMIAVGVWDWVCRAASSQYDYNTHLFPTNLTLFLGYLGYCFAAWHMSQVDRDR